MAADRGLRPSDPGFVRRRGLIKANRSSVDNIHLDALGHPVADGLDLEKVLKPPDTALAAVAGLFVIAKGRVGAARFSVHFDHAGPRPPHDAVRPFRVPGPRVIGQAMDRVIRDGLLLLIERNDRERETGNFPVARSMPSGDGPIEI